MQVGERRRAHPDRREIRERLADRLGRTIQTDQDHADRRAVNHVHVAEHDVASHAEPFAYVGHQRLLRTGADREQQIHAAALPLLAEQRVLLDERDALVHVAGRVDELAGQFVGRVVEHVEDGPVVDDLAVAHDRQVGADVLDDLHLVGDEHDGQAEPCIEVLEQGEDRPGGARVERAGRLVAQQHLRVADQRTRDGDALLLATGKLPRIRLGLVGDTDEFQQMHGLRAGVLAGYLLVDERQGDIVKHGSGWHQVEVLEDHRNLAAQR